MPNQSSPNQTSQSLTLSQSLTELSAQKKLLRKEVLEFELAHTRELDDRVTALRIELEDARAQRSLAKTTVQEFRNKRTQELEDALETTIRALYASGVSVAEIARLYGTTERRTIYKYISSSHPSLVASAKAFLKPDADAATTPTATPATNATEERVTLEKWVFDVVPEDEVCVLVSGPAVELYETETLARVQAQLPFEIIAL